jgi:hypothetical protein
MGELMTKTRGRCLCGEISFEYSGPENWRGHCHCESCRRNTSSPFTTWFGVAKQSFRFTGKEPKLYRSSPGARRLFCSNCGTPMAFEHNKCPDEIHLYAASLEKPENFSPEFHTHCSEQLPWVELADILPRYDHGAS